MSGGAGRRRIVIAPDSFKGALGAVEVADAIADGWRDLAPDDELRLVPMADGGEGTAAAMTSATGGTWITVAAHDPLGGEITAGYGVIGGGATAVIDVAAASGLGLVDRDIWRASSAGTGELIRDALERGVDEIVLGLGGSATNDGGSGLLQALGVSLTDERGEPIGSGAAGLRDLASVDVSGLSPRLREVRIRAACDVTNPLTGPQGASAVFGPQKGAGPGDVRGLDESLARLARTAAAGGLDARPSESGAGAAGGIGFAVRTFLAASLVSGVELVADAVGLRDACRGSSLVLTGEGRLDGQTASGKVPLGVARVARDAGAPCVALVGSVGPGHEALLEDLVAVLPIGSGPRPLREALAETGPDLRRTARQVAGLVR